MFSCCICHENTSPYGKKIMEEYDYEYMWKKSSIIIKDIILEIIGAEIDFGNEKICSNCFKKVIKFFNATKIIKQIRQEILQLIKRHKSLKAIKTDQLTEPILPIKQNDDFKECDLFFQKDEDEIDIVIKDEQILIESPLITPLYIGDVVNKTLDDIDPWEDSSIESDVERSETFSQKETIVNPIVDDTAETNCTQCEKSFLNLREYQAHLQKKHHSGYICDVCGKIYQSFSGLSIHLENHNPENKCKCPDCGKEFKRRDRLKLHMAFHSDEKPFQCEICERRFINGIYLKKHKVIHDNSTICMECEICGIKFRRRAHLNRHMNTHKGLKPYGCSICGKYFTQMHNLKRHLQEHKEPGSTRVQRFKCRKCPRTFTNRENYDKHIVSSGCNTE